MRETLQPLKPLPFEDWTMFRDTFRRDWPTYACYYNWVVNAINWRERNIESDWKIYCPGGKYNVGAFVAVASEGLYRVIVFTFEEFKEDLQEMIKKADVIDWKQNISFCIVHQPLKTTLMRAIEEIDVMGKLILPRLDYTVTNYFKSRDECLTFELQVPDGFYLKSLNVSHVLLVNSLWPHRNKKNPELSRKFLESLVKYNKSVGLFKKDDDSLISWILLYDFGSLGMLQTVEEHKGKGYGKIVVKALVKQLAQEGLDSTLYVVKNNVAAEKLFRSIGYRSLEEYCWISVQPLSF
ncbi:hypothetical protein QAD02_004916 [Eretmocerus hayati]|uniref:Uncharacterized protein n=1 Tax=Eretmocerus hayati TaxID=131215 RepID=A0ACC2NTP3_9HYME|nr:hypothetical protein QAD02_004916 [Eretmocerus hayati]